MHSSVVDCAPSRFRKLTCQLHAPALEHALLGDRRQDQGFIWLEGDMEPKNVILHPNRNLLDPTFESYKLSLQQLPVYAITMCCKPDTVPLAGEEFSYNRTKALSMHNYLFGDPWNCHTCYFVDGTGKVRCISAIVETSIAAPQEVFQLGTHFLQSTHRLPVTISFPSPTLCMISDGTGLVYLIATGNRQEGGVKAKWTAILNEEMAGDDQSPIMLLHSRHFRSSDLEAGECKGNNAIGILSLRFQDWNQDTSEPVLALTDWTILVKPESEAKYSVQDHHTIKGKKAPFYASLGETVTEIYLGCHSKLTFECDWDQQTLEEMDLESEQDFLYSWSQTANEISVRANVPEGMGKNSVTCTVSETAINITFENTNGTKMTIMDGELFDKVDEKLSNWSVADKVLEMTIPKKDQQIWPCVVLGDTRGVLEQEYNDCGTEMPDLSKMRGMRPSGIESYEDCDDLPDINSTLYCFSSVSEKFTHMASVASNQWLFNCYYDENLCTVLRHDVDALVWKSQSPRENCESPWTHIATFNALGYVRASKEDIKYGGCSPNASYSALCESSRRVFVYHSPITSAAPLRNRSTGKQMHISKQQVVTLPSSDQIIGFFTAAKVMFILTKQQIFVIKVNAPGS